MKQVNYVSSSSPYKSAYRPEIDGLRAFAVLSVVAFHAFPNWLKGGFIGVDIFFVISGFLITTHIFESFDKGKFSFTDFFGRRIRRIFPALILVMTCSLAFGWFALLADEFAQLGKHVAGGAGFIINFILVDESGYFDNAAETKPMLHLWSLAVEEQFYIIWPLALWLTWKRNFNLLTITIIVAVLSFYLNLRFVKPYPTETFFWPIGRFWELLSGSVLAWLLLNKTLILSQFKFWIDKFSVRVANTKEIEADGSNASNLMSLIGLLLLVSGVLFINESLSFPSKWALIPVLGAVLVISSGSQALLNRVFLMNPIAVWFGLISYPLYLWHWPILSFLQIVGGEFPQRGARILAVVLSILLAWLTYRFIEKPIRFGSKLQVKTVTILMLLASVGVVGYIVKDSGGVTPYNQKLKYISDAKGDWEFPRGLVEQKYIRATSNNPPKVLMIGDSHIQAFGPRVVDLYRKGLSKEIAFMTKCAPIPKLTGCEEYFDKIDDALSLYPIETVILGGTLEKLLNSYGGKNQYTVKHNDELIALHTEKGRDIAIKSFLELVTRLSASYEVIVLSHAVSDEKFSPSYLVRTDQKRRTIPLSSTVNDTPFIKDNKFEMSVKRWLEPIGVPYASQHNKVCPNNVCYPLTIDGKPKYKDSSHMRPFFVREYMNILDTYLLLSQTYPRDT